MLTHEDVIPSVPPARPEGEVAAVAEAGMSRCCYPECMCEEPGDGNTCGHPDRNPLGWDAADIQQPGWNHVQQAFIDGAREARANPDATDEDFGRASDGYTKRVFEQVDPVSEAALRTESWRGPAGTSGVLPSSNTPEN